MSAAATRRVLLVLLAACSSSGDPGNQATAERSSDAAVTGLSTTLADEIVVDRSQLSGDWEAAADVVLSAAWSDVVRRGPARVVVSPLRDPDGETLRYLLLLEEFDAAGVLVARARSLVHEGRQRHGGGASEASAYLAAQAFPARRLHPGFVLEVLDLHRVALPAGGRWLVLPHGQGWDVLGEDEHGERRVDLEYLRDGATLRLHRQGVRRGGAGGGYSRPPLERLTVEFDARAQMTFRAERQETNGAPWTPLQP